MSKQKILVTGATSRLGIPLVKKLAKAYSLRLLVRNAGEARNLFFQKEKLHQKKLELIEGDLVNSPEAVLEKACSEIDCIVHLAALLDFSSSEQELIKANYIATQRLILAAKKARVQKFLHASSTSVFGKMKHSPITEEHEYTPVTAYGRSKLFAEYAVKQSKLDWIVLRPSAIYGPGFDAGFKQMVEAVKKGGHRIIGSGENSIALVYVDDVANAFVLALKALLANKVKKQDFIITGSPVTQKECFNLLAKQLHVKPPKKHVPKWLAYTYVFVHQLKSAVKGKKPSVFKEYIRVLAEDRVFSTKKAQKFLGWKPRVSLEQGMRAYLKYLGGK